MFQYTAYELFENACIGKRVSVLLHDGTTRNGVLNRIGDGLVDLFEPAAGLAVPIPAADIKTLTFGGRSDRVQVGGAQLAQFRRGCEKRVNESNLSIGVTFADSIRACLQYCENPRLIRYLNAELEKKGHTYLPSEAEVLYDFFRETFSDGLTVDEYTRKVVEVLLLSRMRRFDLAYATSQTLVASADRSFFFLLQVSLAAQMKHHVGVLFWLEKYYAGLTAEQLQQAGDVWWLYLKLCIRYASYGGVLALIRRLSERDQKTALESLAYLLLENGSSAKATRVLEYSMADTLLTCEETGATLDRNGGYLIEDHDNNYHRFLHCINRIFSDGCLKTYSDGDDIHGYVYEYVPDKEFGFILGFDLIPYFFRAESINSESVTTALRQNICSFKAVKDEDPVFVTFRRASESKKTYNAIDIV